MGMRSSTGIFKSLRCVVKWIIKNMYDPHHQFFFEMNN